MSRTLLGRLVLAVAAGAALLGAASLRCGATIQEDSCLEPDIEYPVPCDDDGD